AQDAPVAERQLFATVQRPVDGHARADSTPNLCLGLGVGPPVTRAPVHVELTEVPVRILGPTDVLGADGELRRLRPLSEPGVASDVIEVRVSADDELDRIVSAVRPNEVVECE